MQEDNPVLTTTKRIPWNKGKLIGAKPPLRPKHVWSIRTKLQVAGRIRDLALFNLAIDSKLRGCDVVALKVENVAPSGYAVDRATVRQKKTGQPVKFELTEQTRQSVDDYLRTAHKHPGDPLFTGKRGAGQCMTTRQYARLLGTWVAGIGLDPRSFGTHSLRRTKATLIYRRTGNLRAVQLLLGHTKIESTVRYLGIEVDDALAIAEQVDICLYRAEIVGSARPFPAFRFSSHKSSRRQSSSFLFKELRIAWGHSDHFRFSPEGSRDDVRDLSAIGGTADQKCSL